MGHGAADTFAKIPRSPNRQGQESGEGAFDHLGANPTSSQFPELGFGFHRPMTLAGRTKNSWGVSTVPRRFPPILLPCPVPASVWCGVTVKASGNESRRKWPDAISRHSVLWEASFLQLRDPMGMGMRAVSLPTSYTRLQQEMSLNPGIRRLLHIRTERSRSSYSSSSTCFSFLIRVLASGQ